MSLAIILLPGLILCLALVGLYFLPLAPASRAWLLVLIMVLVMGWALIRRYRWMYWLSSSTSLVAVVGALMVSESSLSLTALSFLYLFVRV